MKRVWTKFWLCASLFLMAPGIWFPGALMASQDDAPRSARRINETLLAGLRPGRDTFAIAEKRFKQKSLTEDHDSGAKEWRDTCSGRTIRLEVDAKLVIQSVTITALGLRNGKCAERQAEFLDPKNWATGLGLRIGDSQDRVTDYYGEPNSSGPASKNGQDLSLDVLPVRFCGLGRPAGNGSALRPGHRASGGNHAGVSEPVAPEQGMPTPTLRPALAFFLAVAAYLSAGCNNAKPVSPAAERAPKEAAETQGMAEAALGKQAEVLAHGDLAGNGLEQILAVNRIANTQLGARSTGNPAEILIRRASVLEKSGGKWSEVLRCDERLKNPNGYLAGTPAARVSAWLLEYNLDAAQGLGMKFTPAGSDADATGSSPGESQEKTLVVRWNKNTKRYQSLDQSQERYLNEVPTLETPMSILK